MTPPHGYTIDSATGLAVPSRAIVNTIQTTMIAPTSSFAPSYVPLPPPAPGTVMQPPSVVNVPPPPLQGMTFLLKHPWLGQGNILLGQDLEHLLMAMQVLVLFQPMELLIQELFMTNMVVL